MLELKRKRKDETKKSRPEREKKKKQKTRRVAKPSQAKPKKVKVQQVFPPRTDISTCLCVNQPPSYLPSLLKNRWPYEKKERRMQPHFFHTRLRTGQPVKMPFPSLLRHRNDKM